MCGYNVCFVPPCSANALRLYLKLQVLLFSDYLYIYCVYIMRVVQEQECICSSAGGYFGFTGTLRTVSGRTGYNLLTRRTVMNLYTPHYSLRFEGCFDDEDVLDLR